MAEYRYLFLALVFIGLMLDGPARGADAHATLAERAVQQGDYGQAIQHWQTVLPTLSEAEQIDALLQMAAAYQVLGQINDAQRVLEEARRKTQRRGDDKIRQAQVLGSLSDSALLTRQQEPARRYAAEAVSLARQGGDNRVLAAALNYQGNVDMAEDRYPDALQAYREGLTLAATDTALTVTLRINAIHAHLARKTPQDALPLLQAALTDLRTLPASYQKALDSIALGHLAQRLIAAEPSQRVRLTPWAYTALTEALELAEALHDSRLKSYATGHLGELYAAAQRYPDATRLWRQALFFAAQSDAPELLARWHWQSGRALRAQGDTEAAKRAYEQALQQLQRVQPALIFGYRGQPQFFRDTVGTMYLELTDLLLQEADATSNAVQRRERLRQVRDVMEGFKMAELKNYFQDECISAYQATRQPISIDNLLGPGSAALYPIVFPDRLVLLLSLAEGDIYLAKVAVTAEALRQTASEFRKYLVSAGNPRRLLNEAQTLYGWLIEPVRSQLLAQHIDTLVIVPDGILRTIPFAALHDGQHFLIEQYALVVTPGLALTEAGQFAATHYRILFNGLSEGIQNFEPLPYVLAEINQAAALYEGTQLLNRAFRKTTVESQLRRTPYTALLFATHGQFLGDPRASFLLAYDGRISLDELERFIRTRQFQDRPVDLIVLSACDTAEGDERAALGLAGVAVKAGARSAVASLWAVNDASTAQLIPAFFANLKNPKFSKAQALQQAQRQLLTQPRTQHPFHWAPFVLIGNWH